MNIQKENNADDFNQTKMQTNFYLNKLCKRIAFKLENDWTKWVTSFGGFVFNSYLKVKKKKTEKFSAGGAVGNF